MLGCVQAFEFTWFVFIPFVFTFYIDILENKIDVGFLSKDIESQPNLLKSHFMKQIRGTLSTRKSPENCFKKITIGTIK